MTTNSAHGNPKQVNGMASTPPNNENQNNDPDANNNEENGKCESANGVSRGSDELCVEHLQDNITTEQERAGNGSHRNCFQTLHNLQLKTDDDCITTSCPNEPNNEYPGTQETTETADPVSARELANQTPEVQTSVTSIRMDKEDKDEEDIMKLLKRPMNSFLLFCKIQRSVLKKHFKVQNRKISEMLGKWWSSLTPEEKSVYRNLSKEHKDKVYATFPDYVWRRKVIVPANASNVTEVTMTEEEAAQILIQISASGQQPRLTTSQQADESDLGSLTDLYTGTGSQQSAVRAVPDQGRPSRLVKGAKYQAFMNTHKKQTNPKKSTKVPSVEQQRAVMQPTNITNSTNAEKQIIARRLLEELYANILRLPVLPVEHFQSIRNADKKRKKTEDFETSASDAKRRKTTADHDDVVVDENNAVGSAPNGTMQTSPGNDCRRRF